MPLVRHKIKCHGWVPDTPDQRDHLYVAPVVQLKKLPLRVNLRPQCPKVIYDQGQLGSCTGNAIARAIQVERLKQKRKSDFIPSRLFIYNERDMEGTIDSDSGAQITKDAKRRLPHSLVLAVTLLAACSSVPFTPLTINARRVLDQCWFQAWRCNATIGRSFLQDA
jgi:hypothetical protein